LVCEKIEYPFSPLIFGLKPAEVSVDTSLRRGARPRAAEKMWCGFYRACIRSTRNCVPQGHAKPQSPSRRLSRIHTCHGQRLEAARRSAMAYVQQTLRYVKNQPRGRERPRPRWTTVGERFYAAGAARCRCWEIFVVEAAPSGSDNENPAFGGRLLPRAAAATRRSRSRRQK